MRATFCLTSVPSPGVTSPSLRCRQPQHNETSPDPPTVHDQTLAEFKFHGRAPIFPHNTISGIVRREVLAVVWQDNNFVRLLTAIYTLTAPTDYLRVDRNRPQVQERIGNLYVKDGEINQPWRSPIRWWLSSATSLWALSTRTIN
jgi:hypothetical protein